MFRIDTLTAAPALPAPAVAGAPGYFTGGNPGTATPPTILDADYMNMVQEELLAVVADGGLSPSKSTYTQVRDAIRAKIAAAIAGLSYVIPSRLVATAGLATGGGNLSADRTITVPKASSADVQAGTDDTKAITPLALAGGFQGSLNTPGWRRSPDGFIDQWGQATHDASGVAVIVFPVAFPTAFLGMSATNAGSGPAPSAWPCGGNASSTGMTIYAAVSSGTPPTTAGVSSWWRAWGH